MLHALYTSRVGEPVNSPGSLIKIHTHMVSYMSVKGSPIDAVHQDTDWREGRDDWFDGRPEASAVATLRVAKLGGESFCILFIVFSWSLV